MLEVALGPCPNCEKPLHLKGVSAMVLACAECGRNFVDDESHRSAIRIATEHDGWIEKIFWKEETNDFLAILLFVFVHFPFGALLWAGWLVTLSLVLWAQWFWAPLVYVALLAAFWLLKKASAKVFRHQIHSSIDFLVCNRGVIVVEGFSRPLFLPWSSIVSYFWSKQIETMTSHLQIEYRTSDNTTASVTVHGNEIEQSLGELANILEARLQR